MAEPARDARGRFTSAGGALHGRRGAEARERRFLQRYASPEQRRRNEREELAAAIALVRLVYRPPWRPRRVPRHELEMAPRFREVLDVLGRAMDAEQTAHRLRAIDAFLYFYSRLVPASSTHH